MQGQAPRLPPALRRHVPACQAEATMQLCVAAGSEHTRVWGGLGGRRCQPWGPMTRGWGARRSLPASQG